jgi:Predicted hydrolase of the HD superfamily (permuted catalytic motifs)
VSLFSELAADMLCREIGIPSTSVVLNAAGNFTIIAPNTEEAKKAIDTVESRINNWLIRISYGENAMGISFVDASSDNFVSGKFGDLWDNLSYKMEKKKFQKIDLDCFGGAVEGYLDSFHNDLRRPLCPFCGKRASAPEVESSQLVGKDDSSCRICRDHIFLGTNLVKKKRVAVTTVDAEIRGAENKLIEPIFDYYQIAFVDGGLNDLARNEKLLKYWDISIHRDGVVSREVAARFINGYVPVYSDEDNHDERILSGKKSEEKKLELIEQINEKVPKTFEHIAAKALNPKNGKEGFCGIAALGVLKADVDNLGLLMACGLEPERFTLSRLATLSRQLNWFFVLYLPYLLKTDDRFKDVYTVFGGGDDLFLLGPWNRITELVSVLHGTFADYVCHNQEIHFSAGMSLHKPHVPLDKLAKLTEAALKQSKITLYLMMILRF